MATFRNDTGDDITIDRFGLYVPAGLTFEIPDEDADSLAGQPHLVRGATEPQILIPDEIARDLATATEPEPETDPEPAPTADPTPAPAPTPEVTPAPTDALAAAPDAPAAPADVAPAAADVAPEPTDATPAPAVDPFSHL